MPGSQAPKTRPPTSKPPSTSGRTTRSTSRAETPAAEPLSTPQSPVDSALPAKPASWNQFSETSTATLCSNLLTDIAAHPDATQTVCTLIRCINLLLPEAFALVSDTNSQLNAISAKINSLLTNLQTEPAAPTPPAFAELGEKLDKVTSDIQKAAEAWQTVPPCSRAQTPPPSSAPLTTLALVGPTRAEISRNRCIQSQGCYILVEPESDGLKTTFDSLNAHMLTKKAELAWDAAWIAIKDSDAARTLKLTKKPKVTFKAALHLARGALDMNWGFGGALCKGQGATILLQCTPTYYDPEDLVAIPRFEEENGLHRGNVLSMTWCKLPHKRKPEQTMAVLKLEMRSHDLADRLIMEGRQLDYSPVLFRKASQEPMHCLHCQRYGHKAAKCVSGPGDMCSQCRGAHRIANCVDKAKKWCVPCQSDSHCSYNRECPTFKAKCTKFNNRCPENGTALFGAPPSNPLCPCDPRHHPIHHPTLTLMSVIAPKGSCKTLFNAQCLDIRSMDSHPSWGNRPMCKEPGQGEDWEHTGLTVRTTPLATGANATPLPPHVPTPMPQQPPSPTRIPTPPPRAYSPSAPTLVTPQRLTGSLIPPTTPARTLGDFTGLPYDVSPARLATRPQATSVASTATITQ
ncbi:hypothetical protein OPQ81_006123 [Rhizoctonia solani]|nr:hypothetical protein OPQ81_006123 [Rhizoctonia solani]